MERRRGPRPVGEAWAELAEMEEQRGDLEAAVSAWTRAGQGQGLDAAWARYREGLALWSLGRLDEARTRWRTVASAPEAPELLRAAARAELDR